MEGRGEGRAAAGCLWAVAGWWVAFGVWLHGARPGVRGGFEGERDWSLLYADLPVMLVVVPSVTLLVRALTGGVLRGRVGRPWLAVVSGTAAVLTMAVLAWVCLAWLDARVAWVSPGAAPGGVPGAATV